MKKISLLKTTFALFCTAFLFLANSTNPPNGRTGAPQVGGGNEQLCSGCHAGNVLGFDGTLEVNGLPSTIMPNTTYPISVDITKVGNVYRAGFQMLILDDDAEDAGTSSNFDSETVQTMAGGRKYIEHGSGAILYGSNNTVSYTFDWTSPNSISGNNITFYAVTVLGNGSGTAQDYSFTNYPTFSFAAATNPLAINAVNTTDPLCNGGNNGSATVMTTGGSGSNTYAWSNGGNTQTVNNLSAGNYMVTVNSGSESISQAFTIIEPTAISSTITNQTSIDCNNSTASATVFASGGTGSLTYLWDNNQTTTTATGLSAGNHSVTVFDANQCQQVQSVTIASDTTTPTSEAGPGVSIDCTSPTVQLNGAGSSAGGNFSYQWQTGNGNIMSGANTLTPTVNQAGTYTLTVTDTNNGCTSSDFVFVTSNGTLPIAEAGQPTMVNCSNSGTVMLNGSGSAQGAGITYQWTGPAPSNIVAGGTTLMPTVNAGGTYTLTVTDTNNGCESTDVVQVTADYTAPTVFIAQANQLNCLNQSVVLDATSSSQGGQFSYQWTASPGGIISSGANTLTPTVTTVGNYTLTVSNNSNGCTESQTIAVVENTSLPMADAGQGMTLTCNNTQVSLNGNGSSTGGNFNYQWIANGGNIVSGANTLTPIVNLAGTYELTVTDNDNGCTSTASVTVLADNTPPFSNIETPSVLNCDAADVALQGLNSSQGINITYLWTTTNGNISGNVTAVNSSANAAGVYCLTVSNNANGCDDQSCVTITAASSPTISLANQTNILCNGEMTGSASVSAQGGDSNYNYAWSNGMSGATQQNLTAGTYQVSVTDGNQCTDELTVEITEPTAITLSLASTDVSSSGASDGTATATANGGTGTLTYLWSNGETTAQINNLVPNNYQVTITDANMCTITGEVSVSSFDCALTIIDISTMDVACNGEATGTATVNATSDATISYTWSSGGNTATESGLIAGTYTVTVADASNCEAIQTVTISEATALLATNTTTDVSCNGSNDGNATLTSTGGTAPYTYIWPNGGDGTNLAAGTYTPTIVDNAGCEITNTVVIAEPTAIALTVSSTVASSDTASDGTATVNTQGGTAGYAYLWNDANSQTTATAAQLPIGNYCVTVTDANNCEETICVDVFVSGCASLAANVTMTPASCNGFMNGTATVNAIGGNGTYTYQWSSGGTGETETGLSAGDYFVTINDTDGCSIVGEVTVMQPTALTVQLANQVNIECAGQTSGSATVQANGGTGDYTYAWSNGGMGDTQMNLSAQTYIVSVTDANQCETTFSLEITTGIDETLPVVIAQNITVALGVDGSATISAVDVDNGSTDNCGIGAYSLSQTSFTCADLGDNEVTLFVDDVNGNTSSDNVIVTVTDAIAPEIICPTTYAVDCTGVVEYEFTATDNCDDLSFSFLSGTESGATFPAGITEVTITAVDTGGNEASCSFDVVVANLLSTTVQTTDVSCFGGEDGAIGISAMGGTAPYSIIVDGGGFEDLSAGIYPVTVTDANGCQTTTEAEIMQPDAIAIEVMQTIDEQNTAANGAIVVDISGGVENYTFSWTGPDGFVSTEEDLVNLSAGDYVLTVTDANGCELTSEVITVDRLTSIEEPTWAKAMRLFPNPATDILTVEVPDAFAIDLTTELLNVTGQRLQTVHIERINNTIRLDVSRLASGLYWLKMQAEDAVVVRKVVVE